MLDIFCVGQLWIFWICIYLFIYLCVDETHLVFTFIYRIVVIIIKQLS